MNEICQAVNSQPPRIVTFYYAGDGEPGHRTVEPHMVAYNRKNNRALMPPKQAED